MQAGTLGYSYSLHQIHHSPSAIPTAAPWFIIVGTKKRLLSPVHHQPDRILLCPSVKALTRQTKGAGSRKAGLTMAYKLMLMAQDNWRKITAPHLLSLL